MAKIIWASSSLKDIDAIAYFIAIDSEKLLAVWLNYFLKKLKY
jgi:hypothetical protein